MSDTTTVAGILRATTDGLPWHGDSVMKTLRSIGAEQAGHRPIPGAHTIHEILDHMIAWQEYTVRALEGNAPGMLEGEADWPPVTDPWEVSVARFARSAERVQHLLADCDDTKLNSTVPGREFKYKILLHGLAHHNVCHQGQISLLSKAGN